MKRAFIFLLAALCAFFCFSFTACQEKTTAHTRYEISVEYIPENRTVTGTVKLTFENPTSNELSLLKCNLYPNAYREDALYRPVSQAYQGAAYYEGESYGETVVSSVNGAKHWEVMGEDENILYIYLERSLYPEESVVLDIGFMTKLAAVNHRTGVTRRTVNLGNFFPTLCGIKNDGFYECPYYSDGDPFYLDCADYKVTLTCPKDYRVASTGETTSERALESKKEHTMSATNARDFALVLSEEYEILTQRVGDTDLFYYYYADETPQESFALARESFSYFEKTFGEYPYPTYTLVEAGFCYDGAEYSCLSMLSDGLTGEGRTRAIAREVAQQWWGTTVGSDQIENAWQDEGLAEYSALLFFEAYEKYGFSREDLVMQALKEYRSYYDVYGSVLGRSDTRMTRHLKEYVSDYEYRCLSYDKAVVMFDALRKSVGEDAFSSALKRYYSANQFKIASVGELVGSFERSGLDVNGFFEGFLLGKGVL